MELLFKRIVFCVLVFLNIVLIASIISYIVGIFKMDISRFEITSNKLPKSFEGFKILQLSDLHNKKFGKNNKKIIKKIEKENPDIIVISGDMVSSNSRKFDNFFDLIEGLDNRWPVYYIFGNHEQRLPLEKQALILRELKKHDVIVINNDYEVIEKGEESIEIYGLQQELIYYNNYFKSKKTYNYEIEDIRRIFPSIDKKKFNILLSHNPLYFETYEKWGADLVFSGHVHGGLIRTPFGGGIISPERKFFPKYSGGEYKTNNSTMIVNRGLGYSTINLRIFNNPEICVVELKSSL